MNYPKCHGLSVLETESLDQQIVVTVEHCINCGLRKERGHVPQSARVELRGRPMPGPRWRAPAKTHEMEG